MHNVQISPEMQPAVPNSKVYGAHLHLHSNLYHNGRAIRDRCELTLIIENAAGSTVRGGSIDVVWLYEYILYS
jgi:hypothetical protein